MILNCLKCTGPVPCRYFVGTRILGTVRYLFNIGTVLYGTVRYGTVRYCMVRYVRYQTPNRSQYGESDRITKTEEDYSGKYIQYSTVPGTVPYGITVYLGIL